MIYFDNSATTRQGGKCIEAMIKAMKEDFANASSLHVAGVKAHKIIENAKQAVASVIGSSSSEILLGSGGTYCNNLAVMSAVTALKRRGRKIIISSIEHPSVEACVMKLRDDGFEVVTCNPLTDDFEKNIDNQTILVSCMLVNNETGLILPASKLKRIIKEKSSPALLHIDAVQALGKIKINVKELDCDFLTVSAHKINGPKGIGALYVKKGVRALPIIYGGEQENGVIPGTYNTPAAAGFAAAVSELKVKNPNHFEILYRHFMDRISELDFVTVNSFGNHAPHIINISFNGYLGENILHFLESYDIYVSQGSACSSHSKQKGKTLAALGKDKRTSDSSVRISFDHNNTIEEIDRFFDVCKLIPDKLIKLYR